MSCLKLCQSSHPLFCVVVCIDRWEQQLNAKRHVNHHPLTLQLQLGLSCITHAFYFPFQQLAALQEQLDSLIEKWPPGGSLVPPSPTQVKRRREPSSREDGIISSWLAVSFLSVYIHTLQRAGCFLLLRLVFFIKLTSLYDYSFCLASRLNVFSFLCHRKPNCTLSQLTLFVSQELNEE